MELLSSSSTPQFIGRTDAKAKAPILWPPDGKSQLIGKDPDAGKAKENRVRRREDLIRKQRCLWRA